MMLSFRVAAVVFFASFSFLTIYLVSQRSADESSFIPSLSAHSILSSGKGAADEESREWANLCRQHHAVLYHDIESTEAYWDRVGGMTRDDLELSRWICERDGNCPILKLYNGQLYIRLPIRKELGFQSRGHSLLLLLSRVDFTGHQNADFLINTNDGVRVYEPCFMEINKHLNESGSRSREEGINHFLLPDFTAYDWWEAHLPAFTEARLSLAESASHFSEKTPKLFWRGGPSLQQGTQRTDLVEQLGPRSDIADVAAVDVNHPKLSKLNFKTLPEMCEYQYIIYTEGVAYSGRLKYTALCNSIQIGHKITFVEFWSHLLEPYYVEVQDWDDAVDKMTELQASPGRAAQLAQGTHDIVKDQLSPRGIACYVQRLLEGYSRSLRFEVLSPEEDTDGFDEDHEMANDFSWVPLEHYLARTVWLGSNKLREQFNTTGSIMW